MLKVIILKSEKKGVMMQIKSEKIDTIIASIFILPSLKFLNYEISFLLNFNVIYVKNIYKTIAKMYPGSHLKNKCIGKV